jgi:flagellar protein FlaG
MMQIQSLNNATSPATSTSDTSAAVARPAPVPDQSQAKGAGAQPTAQNVEAAVSEANKTMKAIAANLQFAVDPETKHTVIKVVDTISNTVLRQIPPQEMLDIAQALDRMKGVLLKQEA